MAIGGWENLGPKMCRAALYVGIFRFLGLVDSPCLFESVP